MRPRTAVRTTTRVLAAALAVARPAAAGPPASEAPTSATAERRPIVAALTLTPGATCLMAGVLADHVRTWLGDDEVDAGLTIEVRGDARRADAATIVLRTADGGVIERTFEATPPVCSDMHAVIGLGVAMAIDASVLEGLGYDVIDAVEAAAPAAAPAVDSERPPRLVRPPPREPPPPARRVRLVAAARGGVWLGALPGVTGGGQLHLEIGVRPWAELRVGVLGGYAARRPLGPGTVDVGLVAGRVDACFGLPRKRLRPRLCLGPAIGAVQAAGRGFQTATRGATPWVAGALALELRVVATRIFSVDVFVDALVPFVRPLVAVREPDKPGMIGPAVNFAPAGAVVGLGGAFTIR